jgi:hypothetical protein
MITVIGTVDNDAVLERLAAGELAEAGRLVVISVEAIRQKVGPRWGVKEPTIWEFAHREFKRLFGPVDQLVKLNDCSYLLSQPNLLPAAAQGRAINFLRNILQFFLGQSILPEMAVGRVVRLHNGEVTQQPLSADELALAERAAARFESVAETHEDGVSSVAKLDVGRPFVISFQLHPIWSRTKNAIVSHRLRPEVQEDSGDGVMHRVDPAKASIREIISVDLFVLDEAIKRLANAPPEGRFGLHAPLHIATMNSTVGRQAVFARLSAAPPDVCKRLVIGLRGLAGAPRVVMDMAVGTLLPFVRGVVGQAPSPEFDASVWHGARLSAISFDLALLPLAERIDLPRVLGSFASKASGVAAGLIGHGIASRAEALIAWSAGFTDLSGDFIGDGVDLSRPMRFEAQDLYRTRASPIRPPLQRSETGR